MKSEDFNGIVNEGILSSLYGAATNNAGYQNSQEIKQFQSLFNNKLKNATKGGIGINDFLNSYLTKNGAKTQKALTNSYQTALKTAKNNVINSGYSNGSIDALGNVVYNILSMSGGANNANANANNANANANNANANNAGANPTKAVKQPKNNRTATPPAANQNPAAGNGQIDPNTNQIIAKIRSIKNTPEEIDDLVDIIAISMVKLYKIAPKNYKRIIMNLVHNGGTPIAPVQQPAAAAATTASTPNYSGGQRQVTPSIIQYPGKFNLTQPVQATKPTAQITNQQPNTLQPNLSTAQTAPVAQPAQSQNNEPTFTDQPLSASNTTTEPKLGNSTGSVSRTPDSMGRIEPTNDQAMRDISRNALDKRINARQNVQKAMTTRSGLPK